MKVVRSCELKPGGGCREDLQRKFWIGSGKVNEGGERILNTAVVEDMLG